MMKRLLYSVVMTLVAFTAFGHATQQITQDENQYAAYQSISLDATRAIDSLSIVLGDVLGIELVQKLHSILDADFDVAQVTKTINQIVNCPEDRVFFYGKQFGVTAARQLRDFKNAGNNLNKKLLLEHLKAELLTDNPIDDNTVGAMGEKYGDFLMQMEQSHSNGESPSDALIDSLSSNIGAMNAYALRNSIDFLDADVDFEQIFKGFEYGLEHDDDDISLAYETAGLRILQTFDNIQELTHMPLNKGLFMEHLLSGLSVESIGEEELQTLGEQIDPLIERVSGFSPEGIANKKAGEAYMEQLRKDKSFKFTESGLAYKMLKEGKGKTFTEDDVVNTIYVGKHLDGTVFKSSEGETTPFSSNFGIQGISEMLLLMKPGAKAIVVIPGNLTYGNIIFGGVGPNETLIFEIETVDSQQ